MKAGLFEYHSPTSLTDALALLEELGDDAKVLAGGQSLVPMLALRLTSFAHLVDLNRIAELSYVSPDGESLAVGAMTRQAVAEHSREVESSVPLLARALPKIGHFQIRNRGTIGGSISHADPASELPAVALCLDAEIEVQSVRGSRRIPAREFFVSTWETAAAPAEVVVALRFPVAAGRSGFAIEEIAWRRGDFAIAGVACAVQMSAAGAVEQAAISLMGMGSTPLRASAAESELKGSSVSAIDFDAIGRLATETTEPFDDIHASGVYRKRVGAVLAADALREAVSEASHE